MPKRKTKPALPPLGDKPYWTEALAVIEREVQVEFDDWTWTAGGCFAFAEAFQACFGGVLYGICAYDEQSGDYPVHHAVIELQGVYYDARGTIDLAAVIRECETSTGQECELKPKTDDDVFWFDDEYLDDSQMQALSAALQAAPR